MMQKGVRNLVLTATGLAWCMTAFPAGAASQSQEIKLLKQQVEALMQQNQALSKRVSEMEQRQASPAPEATGQTAIKEEVARQIEEQKGKGFKAPNLNEYVTLNGSFEGDFKLNKSHSDGSNTSEFNLDTIDLFLGVQVNEWAKGLMVIEYSGDDDDITVDEAHVTLGGTEDFPFFLTGGKIYAPFGDFSTNMIQDPFTQTLGEINDAGVIVGFEKYGIKASVFSYNGIDEGDDTSGSDTINAYGASLGYSYEQDEMGVNAGVAWVSNIGDAGSFGDEDIFKRTNAAGEEVEFTYSETNGLALNFGAKYGPFSLILEYVTALDSFDPRDVYFRTDTNGAQPAAFNSELAYSTQLFTKDTTFAIGYQKSWEAVALDLPEHRYIAAASVGILEGATIILEYYYDESYSATDRAHDPAEEDKAGDGHGFTTRLRYEF